MAIPSSRSLPDLSKLEPLDGSNYKRWSQKLLIFFEQLEVDYVLFEEMPAGNSETSIERVDSDERANGEKQNDAAGIDKGNDVAPAKEPTVMVSAPTKDTVDGARRRFDKDNKTVRGHMLNHMTNVLFDLLVNIKSAKQIWDMLEKKYGADDAGKKKYVVGKWLQFRMVDDKPIMDQLHDYENLTADILNEGMKLCEIFQANVLLEKFPPSWTDYRNQLKHKKRDLTLQELISHMRTEEANRLKDKNLSLPNFNANLVESSVSSGKEKSQVPANKRSFKNNKQKASHFNKGDKKIMKRSAQFNCYVCGKPGHKAYQCFKRQGQEQRPDKPGSKSGNQVHLAETDDIIVAVVEANLVEKQV